MCNSDWTGPLQIGHLLLWVLKLWAHSLHKHICRQGSTAVSLGSDKQMTHNESPSSSTIPSVLFSSAKDIFCK